MEHLGLKTAPGRFESKALSASQLQRMLQNRYYLGYVIFKGEEIKGRHQAIIDPELFDDVQSVMDSRGRNHVRKRIHDHYLKGALWCYPCHDQGHEYRLIRQQSKGRGGTYDYFFCRGRQEHVCDSRYMSTDEIEEAVEAFYARTRLPEKFIESVRQKVADVVLDSEHSTTLQRRQIQAELNQLSKKENNLLDLVSDGQLPGSKVRSRISALNEQQARLTQQLESLDDRLEAGAEVISEAIELLNNSEDLYSKFSNSQRYLLNRALFKKLYIRDGDVVCAEYNEPFNEMISAYDVLAGTPTFPDLTPVVQRACDNKRDRLATVLSLVGGSSKTLMVGAEGLEPPTCWL
jgi:site-specific DNA recombinase